MHWTINSICGSQCASEPLILSSNFGRHCEAADFLCQKCRYFYTHPLHFSNLIQNMHVVYSIHTSRQDSHWLARNFPDTNADMAEHNISGNVIYSQSNFRQHFASNERFLDVEPNVCLGNLKDWMKLIMKEGTVDVCNPSSLTRAHSKTDLSCVICLDISMCEPCPDGY